MGGELIKNDKINDWAVVQESAKFCEQQYAGVYQCVFILICIYIVFLIDEF